MDTLSVFKGKRVLVTGSTGFKGSWLCIWLHKLGARVYGYALKPKTEKDNFVICGVSEHITQSYGRLSDIEKLQGYMDYVNPDFIFHLAAQPLVIESVNKPLYTLRTNVIGTANVLEAARNIDDLKSIVVITSDKCYANNENNVMNEDSPLGGDDPYSASKACAELITNAYHKTYFEDKGIGVATARGGNVIGGGDRGEYRIIPDCVNAVETNSNVILRNPTHSRPWQYILDSLYGYLVLGAKLSENSDFFSRAYNFGPRPYKEYSVFDITSRLLAEVEDMGIKYDTGITKQESKIKEKGKIKLDSSDADWVLGVSNILDFNTMIRWTAEDYFKPGDTYTNRLNRIIQYEEMLNGV